jgi:glycosyltransferase
MKISVITVCFNSAEFILDAIKSVNNQLYPNVEHIFIDGKSTDRTLMIIDQYCTREKIVISEADNGVYDAMNKGFSMASGDIICLLNSDDFYSDDNAYCDIIREFSCCHVDYLWGDLAFVNQSRANKTVRYWRSRMILKDGVYKTEIPPHPSFFMRRSVMEQHPKFNLNYHIASDFDYMKNVILDDSLIGKYVRREFVKMRLGGLSTSDNIVQQNMEIYRSLKTTFPKYNIFYFLIFKAQNKLRVFFGDILLRFRRT